MPTEAGAALCIVTGIRPLSSKIPGTWRSALVYAIISLHVEEENQFTLDLQQFFSALSNSVKSDKLKMVR